MKVLIFDSTTLDKAPYLENYTKVFDAEKIDYDICTWDKYTGSGQISRGGKRIVVHKKWHLGKRKIADFFVVSNILRKIIKENKYTHFVIVNSVWAILLFDILLKNKNKYILDIRDYKCENVFGIKILLKQIIENSFFTTISSGGFRVFLPQNEKIIENHNISNLEFEEKGPSLFKGKHLINIVYMGHVRYFDENKKLINILKDNDRLTLTYMGTYANGYNIKNKNIKNVIFKENFDNKEKPFLYKNYDIIHSLYGNKDISVITLTPNRLYDAVQYKKPILASKGTYLGEIVEKYNLGVVLDLDNKKFKKLLLEYIDTFNPDDFTKGAETFLKNAKISQYKYYENIKNFIMFK